ncbi:MAG: ABC transporter substrate-binding protein [Desulfobacula sp.]|nr:ABC transporter substrate-binding protein [Desulfobacula sp.]
MKKYFFLFAVISMVAAVSIPVSAKTIELNYRLKWKFNTSVAGDIYADASGGFKRNGLEVNVKAGGVGINAIRELELGRAQFGVASADQVILALEKGAKIVVIAQLFQANPMQWIYRADQPEIKTLDDLRGRRIGITFGGNDEAIMMTIFAKGNLTKKDVTIISVQGNALPFFKRDADVWPVYRNSQGVGYEAKLFKEGEKVRFFNPKDFGVNFVANSVVTSQTMIEKSPQLVDSFLKALLTSWEASMDPANETNVLEAIKKLDGGINDDIRKKQLAATRKLIKPVPEIKIGTIDVAAWEQTEAILIKQGQIKKRVDVTKRLIQIP